MQQANPQPRKLKKRHRKRLKSSQRLIRRPKCPPMFNMRKNPNRKRSKNRPRAVKINNQLSQNSRKRPQLPLHNQKLNHKKKKKIKHLKRKNLKKKQCPLPKRKLKPQESIIKSTRKKMMKSKQIKKIKPRKNRKMKMRRKTEKPRSKIRKIMKERLRMGSPRLMTGMKAKRSMRLE